MKFIDYYDIMGVAEDASADEIKRAYRRLARKYHPDVSSAPDAEDRFKELGEAYEVLRDPDKRAEYDQLRRLGARPGEEFRPPPGWHSRADFGGGGFTEADAARFSDFFEAIFGGRGGGFGSGARFVTRGEDMHHVVEISLEEAFAGATRNLRMTEHRVDAEGRVVPATRSLNVRIPDGVVDGQRIRLRGQGGKGTGGAPDGDLYLEIRLRRHPRFTADGRDVSIALPVAPWEAALGATVRVPTLGGAVDVNIPANARSGQKLRLKGRGLPGDPPGDQLVILQIVMPPVTSERQRELLRQLNREFSFDPRSETGASHGTG